MRTVRQVAKGAYTMAASYFGEHRRSRRESRLWVLMYHRVLPKSDPRYAVEEPGMLVTPETLKMHLEEVKHRFSVVSLSDWVDKARRGEPLPAKACAITFDDGWLDNYEYALPLLKENQVPATLFAVADKVSTDFRFWPNIVSELVAARSPALALHPLLADAHQLAQRGYTRDELASVIHRLKEHSEATLYEALDSIEWQQALPGNKPVLMNWEQLHTMVDSGWVEVGSHTCSHLRLDKGLDQKVLEKEIHSSRTTIEKAMKRPAPLFCFPNGDYDSRALRLVREGYVAAVTTQRGINYADRFNPHEIQRIALHEDGSNTRQKFLARLSGW